MFIGDVRRQLDENRLSLLHQPASASPGSYSTPQLSPDQVVTPGRSFQLPSRLPGVGAHSVDRRLKKMPVLRNDEFGLPVAACPVIPGVFDGRPGRSPTVGALRSSAGAVDGSMNRECAR